MCLHIKATSCCPLCMRGKNIWGQVSIEWVSVYHMHNNFEWLYLQKILKKLRHFQWWSFEVMTVSYIPALFSKILFSKSLTADFSKRFSIQKLLHIQNLLLFSAEEKVKRKQTITRVGFQLTSSLVSHLVWCIKTIGSCIPRNSRIVANMHTYSLL